MELSYSCTHQPRVAPTHSKLYLPFSAHRCVIAGLDSESIWSELELRNMPLEKHTRKTLARLLQSEDMSVRSRCTAEVAIFNSMESWLACVFVSSAALVD